MAQDARDSSAAVLMLFYKWCQLPPLQLLISISRRTDGVGHVTFESVEGLPLRVDFLFTENEDGGSDVKLHVRHGVPVIIAEFVGIHHFDWHVASILKENVEVLRLRLNGELAEDGMQAYYAEHRRDSFDGPPLSTDLAGLPELEMVHEMPEGRQEEVRRYVSAAVEMQARLFTSLAPRLYFAAAEFMCTVYQQPVCSALLSALRPRSCEPCLVHALTSVIARANRGAHTLF